VGLEGLKAGPSGRPRERGAALVGTGPNLQQSLKNGLQALTNPRFLRGMRGYNRRPL